MSGNADAARTINSVTLNGAGSITVLAGDTVSATLNVTTDALGATANPTRWRTSGWLISATPPGTLACENTSNHNAAGTYNETMNITAPGGAGTYSAYFVAYEDNGCSVGASSVYTLSNAVTVVDSELTINSATVDGAATTTVAAGAPVAVSYSFTVVGGGEEVEGTRWRIATTPPGSSTCANSAPDSPNNTDGVFTTGFPATAPVTPGTYNLYLLANSADNCGGASSAVFVLNNAVVVQPPVPTVVSISRVTASPSAAASVAWTVTFSQSVSGVDATDFSLAAVGVTGTGITSVAGSGTTWTVTANSGAGSGSLGLNLVDNNSIVAGGVQLGGPVAGDGDFTGEVYVIDKGAPSVLSLARANASPTNAASVSWTVTFSESVSGVDAADFSLVQGGGMVGAAITGVVGAGSVWTVSASTGNLVGTLGLNLVDDDSIVDGGANPLGGVGAGNGSLTGEVYVIDGCPPPSNLPGGLTVTCVCDNFTRATLNPSTIFGANWTATASDTTGVLPRIANSGYLRLTENTGNNAKAVTVPGIFPAAGNYISVEFRHYAYKTGGATGADGIAVTLSDYAVPPQPGAFGGSLGYAQRTGVVGFAGGWLGVALDEYGNFSNPTEGRLGGSGFFPQSVTARASGSGMSDYRYLGHAVVGNVDNTSSATPARGFLYQVVVDARNNTTGSGPTGVQVNRDTGSGYGALLSFPNIFTTATGLGFTQAVVPNNWQISFTGSTGGSTNTHEIGALKICAQTVFPPTGGVAANFNVIDESYGNSTLNALQGHLITKLAATPFAVKVAALRDTNSDGVADGIQTAYVISGSKTVRVELLDDSATGTSCNSSAAACSACSKPVVAAQSMSFAAADAGFKQSANFTIGGAYSRLIARVCEGASCPGAGAVGCSVDAFAVRPSAFTQVSSSASNSLNSGTPVFKAGTDTFTLTARANAPEYKGKPKIEATAVAARDTALASGLVGNLTPVVAPAEAANVFPSNSGYANTPPVTPTATDVSASFTYSEAGSFRLLDKPASAPVITDVTARGIYDDSWTQVDQGASGDCVLGSFSNVKDGNGRFGCLFGNTASSSYFGRFIPDRFEVDANASALVNRGEIPVTSTTGTYAAGATDLSVTAGTGSAFSVGEKIVVIGGGPGGAPLVTTVQAAGVDIITLAAPLGSALGSAVSLYRPAAHGFTYLGEPLLTVTGLRAVNGAGTLTQNYTGFAVGNWTDPASGNTLGLGLGNAGGSAIVVDSAAAAVGWRSGLASIAVRLAVSRAGSAVGPYAAAAIGVAPKDADGVALASFDLDADGVGGNERQRLGTTALRYGRARVSNAFGSEQLPLQLPAEVQYWSGSYWQTNMLDIVGSVLALPTITKTAGAGTVTQGAGNVYSTTATTPGRFTLTLNSTGPAAVDLDYTVDSWLLYPAVACSGPSSPPPPPACLIKAKASFGLYPGSNRFIYRREVR